MPRKITISVPLDQGQLEKLRLLSERTKVPMTVYTGEGIDRVLELHKPQLEQAAVSPARKRQPTHA